MTIKQFLVIRANKVIAEGAEFSNNKCVTVGVSEQARSEFAVFANRKFLQEALTLGDAQQSVVWIDTPQHAISVPSCWPVGAHEGALARGGQVTITQTGGNPLDRPIGWSAQDAINQNQSARKSADLARLITDKVLPANETVGQRLLREGIEKRGLGGKIANPCAEVALPEKLRPEGRAAWQKNREREIQQQGLVNASARVLKPNWKFSWIDLAAFLKIHHGLDHMSSIHEVRAALNRSRVPRSLKSYGPVWNKEATIYAMKKIGWMQLRPGDIGVIKPIESLLFPN